jgi:uncharacterized protein YbjT (DUF2867 family)
MLPDRKRILLTGATGYVGGRLLKELERLGYSVRCLARRPVSLLDRLGENTEVVAGDVMDYPTLPLAMDGVDVAYYLVHSMGVAADFEEQDRLGALNFARAARESGVERIIYLGGLSSNMEDLSQHLRSRVEVGRILRESGVATVELQASIIIGSGSLSFELIRSLVERLPLMITPRWVRQEAQPIFIDDVLQYLVAAIDLPVEGSRVYQIGGADRVSYGDLMNEYARQRGLLRIMIPVPVLTPWLSSLWLNLITPVYARIGRKLIDSIRVATVVSQPDARQDFAIQPIGFRQAILRVVQGEEQYWNETRWSDSLSSVGPLRGWGGVRFGNRLYESHSAFVPVDAERAFAPILRFGGETGWYYADWLWHARGFLDYLVGGVGLRRGRRDPDKLRVGEALDFWRVDQFIPGRRLRLQAEMKLPGRAWLEFEVHPVPGGAEIHQTAVFDPVGLAGQLYWYGLYPLHRLIFTGMLRRIAQAAQS